MISRLKCEQVNIKRKFTVEQITDDAMNRLATKPTNDISLCRELRDITESRTAVENKLKKIKIITHPSALLSHYYQIEYQQISSPADSKLSKQTGDCSRRDKEMWRYSRTNKCEPKRYLEC